MKRALLALVVIWGFAVRAGFAQGTPKNAQPSAMGNGSNVVDPRTMNANCLSGSATLDTCLASAYAALPNSGGTIEARGYGGSQSMGNTVSFSGGESKPTATYLPVANINVASGKQWALSSQQNLFGQGVYNTNFLAGVSTTPLFTTAPGASKIQLANLSARGAGATSAPFLFTGDGLTLSNFSNLISYGQQTPSVVLQGGYYNVFRDVTLLPAATGGRTISLQAGRGYTANSNMFDNILPWNGGGTAVYRDVSSSTDPFLKPDIENSGIGFDDKGQNQVTAWQYGEAGGSTSIAWAPNKSYSAGTYIKDSHGRGELCILAGTSGGSAPAWPNPAIPFANQTNDGTAVWEIVPSFGGNIWEPDACNNWHIGPEAQVTDYSWCPTNVLMSSQTTPSVYGGGGTETQCGTAPFCIPSTGFNGYIAPRGGASIMGGLSVMPLQLPAPTVNAPYSGGNSTVGYAVNCKLSGDGQIGYMGGAGSITQTGLTTFTSVRNSVPRSQLGQIYAVSVSRALEHYYFGIPLEGYNTQNYNGLPYQDGTGWNTGDTFTLKSPYGGSGAVFTVIGVTAANGGVTSIKIGSAGSLYQSQFFTAAAPISCASGKCTGLRVDVAAYMNYIYLPPFGTGNGGAGYANVRTTACLWDIAVNDSSHSLVTNYAANGYGLASGLLQGAEGVYYDYGQNLNSYAPPARNSTGDVQIGSPMLPTPAPYITVYGTQLQPVSSGFPFETSGMYVKPSSTNANLGWAFAPNGAGNASLLLSCYSSMVSSANCNSLYSTASQFGLGSMGAAVKVCTMAGSASCDNVLDDGSGHMAPAKFASATSNQVCYAPGNQLAACSSLRSLKRDIQPLPLFGSLEELMAMRPVSYLSSTNHRAEAHFVAEDILKLDPKCATFDNDGKLVGVNDGCVLAIAVAAIQQQQRQIEALEKQVAAQQVRLKAMESGAGVVRRVDDLCNLDAGTSQDARRLRSLLDLYCTPQHAGLAAPEESH